MPNFRPFRGDDTQAFLSLWNAALPLDGLTQEIFERKVLLDANLEPESLLLAFEGDRPVGFILRLRLLQPIEMVGLLEERGFITAMGVHPDHRRRGIGQALLDDTFEFFRKRNRKEIVIAPYTPNYFVPGIDKENYAEGVRLFRNNGFAEYSEGIAMDASIPLFRLAPEVIEKERALAAEGIIFRPLGREDILPYLQFLKECMPGPWVEDARRNLLDATKGIFDYDACLLALDGGKIIGYCAFEREHYGPYGVSDKYQGKGIGTVLMARTLDLMRQKGYHSAWVLWTGERAAKGVYGRLGFKITRRFAIMKKTL